MHVLEAKADVITAFTLLVAGVWQKTQEIVQHMQRMQVNSMQAARACASR